MVIYVVRKSSVLPEALEQPPCIGRAQQVQRPQPGVSLEHQQAGQCQQAKQHGVCSSSYAFLLHFFSSFSLLV